MKDSFTRWAIFFGLYNKLYSSRGQPNTKREKDVKLAQGASEIPYNNTNKNKYDATGYLQNASTYALQNYLDYNLLNNIYKIAHLTNLNTI